jgi:SMC interacting uncharacterized protein involved in chromosome segregation
MNASPLSELRNGLMARDLHDERMDQIRELLFGDLQRETDERMAQLEGRIRELETVLNRRLDALQARLDAMAGEVSSSQRTAFDELSHGVQELGERIRRLARD